LDRFLVRRFGPPQPLRARLERLPPAEERRRRREREREPRGRVEREAERERTCC